MGQGFALIHRVKFTWMDELVPEPREFRGIESLHQPVDHAAHPGDAAAAGMVGEPDIEWPAQLDLDRDQPSKRAGVSRKHANAGAISDGPVIGAADIRLHYQQVALRKSGEETVEHFL